MHLLLHLKNLFYIIYLIYNPLKFPANVQSYHYIITDSGKCTSNCDGRYTPWLNDHTKNVANFYKHIKYQEVHVDMQNT